MLIKWHLYAPSNFSIFYQAICAAFRLLRRHAQPEGLPACLLSIRAVRFNASCIPIQ